MAATMEEVVSKPRVQQLFKFMQDVAKEDAGKSNTKVMLRRRCRVSWVQDRTFMSAAICIIAAFGDSPEKLIWMLMALCYGVISWRNLRILCQVPGDAPYGVNDPTGKALGKIYDEFDADALNTEWLAIYHAKKLKKKAYDTNVALAKRSSTNSWITGFVNTLQIWKAALGKMVLTEIQSPLKSTAHTLLVLQTTGMVPEIPATVMARLLGLWDSSLYSPDSDFTVMSGAAPVADYLVGDPIDWEGFVKEDHTKKKHRNYADILWQVRKEGERHWYSDDGIAQFVPEWVDPTLQVYESSFCEQRKKFCEERAAAEKYVQTPGYSKLHDDFEASMFVHEGRLRSFNGQAYTRRELPPRPMPQEQEVSGVHVRYDGHLYQCVSTYCDNTKGLKNSQSKLRAKVMKHAFQASEMLIIPGASKHNTRHWPGTDGSTDLIEMEDEVAYPASKRRKLPNTYTELVKVKALQRVAHQARQSQ